jgi:hypothetical protein
MPPLDWSHCECSLIEEGRTANFYAISKVNIGYIWLHLIISWLNSPMSRSWMILCCITYNDLTGFSNIKKSSPYGRWLRPIDQIVITEIFENAVAKADNFWQSGNRCPLLRLTLWWAGKFLLCSCVEKFETYLLTWLVLDKVSSIIRVACTEELPLMSYHLSL